VYFESMGLLTDVLKDIKPIEENKEIDLFLKRLEKLIWKNSIKAEVFAGGSIAKGTFLKNDYDVDIFVKFDLRYKDKDISKILEKVLKPLNPELVHGSRDYFSIEDKLSFEIIPVLNITKSEQAENIMDMSPLHVDWVIKNSNVKLRNEIRLAKQFCKSINVYGAESYIKGFSGHVLDILVIYYGGFLKLLRNAVKWYKKEVIDYHDVHKSKALSKMNKSKIFAPLIVVDPIMPERNAAAALSMEKFLLFKEAANRFLSRPSKNFFKIEGIRKNKLKVKGGEELFFIKVEPLDGKKDVVGAKLLKAYTFIKLKIKGEGFNILETGWEFKDIGVFYFIVEKKLLSSIVTINGPPSKDRKNVKGFKKKHNNCFISGGRIFAREKREYMKAYLLIKDLIKDKYVKERVKKIILS
jgi:tRNA nucleotidyltransferase (CCA-adding enzyme)